MKAIMRQAKNTVMQFSDIECKVREATSNDSWGASTSQMAEIAKATNDYQEYPQLFAMLWKRLNDVEHIMHVQKALILVEYLLRNGADRFINDAKRRARDIAALKKYKHYDANNQDDAKEARAKAKVVYDMLMDDAKLQEERAKALKIRDVRLTGFGSEGGNRYGGYAGDYESHDRNGDGRGASHDYGNGSAGTGAATGTIAAPRRRKDSQEDADPFDSSAASAPVRKSTAKDKPAASTIPETEPVKKKKKKKTVAADTEAAENESTALEAISTPKLEAPVQDAKKKKKKKKSTTEETKEAADEGDFDDPFSGGHSQPNGQASARYAAAAAASASASASSGNGRSFVDEFADAVPVAYQPPPQDVDFLTGRPPISVGANGDLVDLFSAPNPASPMNAQKLHEISQQPFDPLGRDPNFRATPEPRAIEAPKDLWGATDLMNLNDITKSTAKPAKKLAATGPTMAELRAQKPSTSEVPLTNLGLAPSAAPSVAPPAFQPPVYGAAPMGMGMGMGMAAAPMGYPPVQQMGALSLGYPPQAAGYPPAYGYPGYQQAQPQPMLALMPPSAYSSTPTPAQGSGFVPTSTHGELPFAVSPGSRPQPAYNSNKPVIFDVVSAQKAAQAQADPHYNYNTSQRGSTARQGQPNSNLASNW